MMTMWSVIALLGLGTPRSVFVPQPLRHSTSSADAATSRARCLLASEVDHVTRDAVDGLLDGLTERRVREDVAGHLVGGEVPLLRQRHDRQQLGDVGAD